MTGAYELLPTSLPAPADDGAADHLSGAAVPSLRLTATTGHEVDLAELARQRTVLFVYPRTGQPGVALPAGWDEIPGARGCTPETIGFRDHAPELADLDAGICGLSSQDQPYQAELAQRLGLPFPILSDPDLRLAAALTLPTFDVDGVRLYKRITLVLNAGRVEHVFYPVFPTDTHAAEVMSGCEPTQPSRHNDHELDTVMSWTWRLEGPDGAVRAAAGAALPAHSTQSDAETWIGENWRGLAEDGIASVTLLCDGNPVYGPMPLSE